MVHTTTVQELDSKSVFITCGGAGIGASLTDGFLAQGAQVAYARRSDATGFCDITDSAALQPCLASAGEAHGPVTARINNAANDKRHGVLDVDEPSWDWSQSINLKACFFASQAAIPMMRAARGGAIANFSSISDRTGNASHVSYTIANSGINGRTRALAREFGPDRIRANALAPDRVLTEKQVDTWATPEALAAHLERQCLKDHPAPQDIADERLFLASEAGRMMTGQVMVIDGGMVVTG